MDEQTEMELGQEAQYVEQEAQREQWISELQEENKTLKTENEKLKTVIETALSQYHRVRPNTVVDILTREYQDIQALLCKEIKENRENAN